MSVSLVAIPTHATAQIVELPVTHEVVQQQLIETLQALVILLTQKLEALILLQTQLLDKEIVVNVSPILSVGTSIESPIVATPVATSLKGKIQGELVRDGIVTNVYSGNCQDVRLNVDVLDQEGNVLNDSAVVFTNPDIATSTTSIVSPALYVHNPNPNNTGLKTYHYSVGELEGSADVFFLQWRLEQLTLKEDGQYYNGFGGRVASTTGWCL